MFQSSFFYFPALRPVYQALYLFRQQLDADGTWICYNDMDKIMKLF